MRARIIVLALLLAAPLAGCNTMQALVAGSVAQSAPQTVSDAEKGLTLAHLAYQGIGDALKDAATSGALKGAAAATAKGLYDEAGAALDAADRADSLANAQAIVDKVGAVNALILQVKALIPEKLP
jgi:predicted small secreted protein